MTARELTAERLRELVQYSPETGEFTRRKNGPGFKVGDKVAPARKDGYVYFKAGGVRVLGHRAAFLYMTGELPAGCVDHLNGDRSDNRWPNLREATGSVNAQNQREAHRNSASGRLGVSWVERKKKWRADIKVGGKPRHLGCFSDIEAASAAYVAAKRAAHEGCTL